MRRSLTRPPGEASDSDALLGHEHFQCAYVTDDLDFACAEFGSRYGIKTYSFLEGDLPAGGSIRVAFAWAGGTMYEIIDAKGPGAQFYTNWLPANRHSIRFHHLGYLLGDRGAWCALERHFDDAAMPVAFKSLNPGFMDALYVEAPSLGHYLEYIFPDEAGLAFFEAVPKN